MAAILLQFAAIFVFAAANPVTESARSTMAYRLKTCENWHQYEKGLVDWKLNPTYNGYCEYVWQLGRFNFFADLAAYYADTRDPEAARTWVNMISTWIDQADYDAEPRKSGFDGTCWRTLDAGIRVKNWANSYLVFKDAPEVTPEFLAKFRSSLAKHGGHLVRWSTSRNWLIYELTGLMYLVETFPDLPGAAEWRRFALSRLETELKRQLYPDGFHYELSSGYHGAVPANYSEIYALMRRNGDRPPAFFVEGLENAYALYMKLMRPDGLMPALSDAGNADSRKYLSDALGFYPSRSDFRYLATKGAEGTVPGFNSIALEYSGSVVMRTGWGEKDLWAYMDAGPVGRGHQHDDKLNFLLFAYGKELIRDGGIYDYDSSEMRQYVLDSRSHNLAMIDGRSQNRREGYKWNDAELHQKAGFEYGFGDEIEWVCAEYSGRYGYRTDGYLTASQRRTVYFMKRLEGLKPFFVVSDVVAAKDADLHSYDILWHLEEVRNYRQSERDFTADFGDGVKLHGFLSAGAFKDRIGETKPSLQGWKPVPFVQGPHPHIPIHTPTAVGSFKGSRRIVTVLYPDCGGQGSARPTDNGRAACPHTADGCPIVSVIAGDAAADRGIKIVLKDAREIVLDETTLKGR